MFHKAQDFILWQEAGWGTAVASDVTKSPLVFIEGGGNTNNKVFSASAWRKCVSLLTGADANDHVFNENG